MNIDNPCHWIEKHKVEDLDYKGNCGDLRLREEKGEIVEVKSTGAYEYIEFYFSAEKHGEGFKGTWYYRDGSASGEIKFSMLQDLLSKEIRLIGTWVENENEVYHFEMTFQQETCSVKIVNATLSGVNEREV